MLWSRRLTAHSSGHLALKTSPCRCLPVGARHKTRAQDVFIVYCVLCHTSHIAGAAHGQQLPPGRMEELIRAAGRTPYQRTTLYGVPPVVQVERSLDPKWDITPLEPLVMN